MTPPQPGGRVPSSVTRDLRRLEAALDAQGPAKSDSNALMGTWNLRAFSGLTPKWQSATRDTPKRDWRAVARCPVNRLHAMLGPF